MRAHILNYRYKIYEILLNYFLFISEARYVINFRKSGQEFRNPLHINCWLTATLKRYSVCVYIEGSHRDESAYERKIQTVREGEGLSPNTRLSLEAR
jgi:hypothetical protein